MSEKMFNVTQQMLARANSGMIDDPTEAEIRYNDPKIIQELLVSEHLRRAFTELHTKTVDCVRESETQNKRLIVAEMLDRKLLSAKILRNNPTVYIGAGTDIEFPLLLGARKLLMIDYRADDYRGDIEQRISKLINSSLEQSADGQWSFAFDFGQGEELVTIDLQKSVYREPPIKTSRMFAPHSTPEQIGLLMKYRVQTIKLEANPETLERVLPGGYVLVDEAFPSVMEKLSEEDLHNPNPAEVLTKRFQEGGWRFIPLKTQSVESFTFLQKEQVTAEE